MTDYERFIHQQKKTFITQFMKNPVYCWTRIPNLNCIRPRNYQKTWLPLTGFVERDAIVWDEAGDPELWVRPVDKRFCAIGSDKTLYVRAWKTFVNRHGKTEVESNHSNVPHVIDHLSPETAAARHGYSHVRVILIEATANTKIGATIEKVLANYPYQAGGYCSDWTTMAKVLGMKGSWKRSRPAKEIAAEILTLIRNEGIDLNDKHVEEMLPDWIDYRRFGMLRKKPD